MRSTCDGKARVKVRAKQSLGGLVSPARYTLFKVYSSGAIPRHGDIHTLEVIPPVLVPE